MSAHYSHRHIDTYNDRLWSLNHATEAVWYIAYIVEAILLVRFSLSFLGADPNAPFAGFVYAVSDIFLAPFHYILPAIKGGRVEAGTLISMGIYWVLAWAVQKFFLKVLPAREGLKSL
jgi:uncharacterized protein YggT (Ycf19 family)